MPRAFRHAHARGASWQPIAQACLEQLGELGARHNLGFLYFTDALVSQASEIVRFFRANTPVRHWVGSVAAGVFAGDAAHVDEPAIAVLVGEFPSESFQPFSGIRQAFDPLPPMPFVPYLGVVHGDPFARGLAQSVALFAGKMQSGFLVGGVTSSRGRTVQLADQLLQGGLSGVCFSDRVPMVTRLTQGCAPLGPKHIVTDCEQNVIAGLDHRPALDVLKADMGDALSADLARIGGHIFAALPIAGSDREDYLVRNLIGIDIKRKLVAVGEELEAGMPLMFCKRDGASARADMQRMLQDIRRDLTSLPKAGLYYSCVGRGRHMFGTDTAELEMIGDALGEFPLVGFSANGEISHDRLYAYTGVLALFV